MSPHPIPAPPDPAQPAARPRRLLEVEAIEVVYGGAILAVADVSLVLEAGGILALLGANGAGKSTTLKAISGLAATDLAEIRRGRILFDGIDVAGVPANRRALRGMVQVMEGRHCFPQLTIEENLRAGGFLRRPSRAELKRELERVYHWFPRLAEKRRTRAGLTSGGEQQMAAIGRALMTQPRLVLLDEPSMGLAPIIVDEIFAIVAALNRENGTSFLIAEQNAFHALSVAHRVAVLDNGRVAAAGTAAEIAARGDVGSLYFGGS